MDETPDRPPVPDGDGDPPTTPFPPADDARADDPRRDDPWGDDDAQLPPLGDGLDGDAPPRKRLTPVRLAAAVVVLALLGGIAFVGLSGSDSEDDGGDGVASIDGDDGTEDATDDGDGSGGGGRVDDAEFQDAMLEFAACMREHGIDMPDPEFDSENGGGVLIAGSEDGGTAGQPTQEEFEAADEACQPIMEEVAPDIQLTPEEQAEMQDQMVAVAECMREKGWDMPDPVVTDDGKVQINSGPDDAGNDGMSPDNMEEHRADMQACNEELGFEGPGGGPGVATRAGGDS